KSATLATNNSFFSGSWIVLPLVESVGCFLQNLLVVLYARLEQVNLNAKLRKLPCSISKSLLELCSELFELCLSLLELLFVVPKVDACVVAESLELFLRDSVMLFLNLTGSLFGRLCEHFFVCHHLYTSLNGLISRV